MKRASLFIGTDVPPVAVEEAESPTDLVDRTVFAQRLRADFVDTALAGEPCSLAVVHAGGYGDVVADVLGDFVLEDPESGTSGFALGKGQFALLLPGFDLGTAAAAARTVELRVAFRSNAAARVAIGIAASGPDASSPDELFACAHLAMLQARSLSGGRTVIFGHELERHSDEAERVERATARLLAHIGGFLPPTRPQGVPARDRLRATVGDELIARLPRRVGLQAL